MKFILTNTGYVEAEKLNLGMAYSGSKWTPQYWIESGWTYIKEDAVAHAKEAITHMTDSYYELISYMYKTLTEWITTIPIDMLSNDNAYKMQGVFMCYSVLMVIFLAIGEGFKALFGVNYTKPATIFGRTFISFIGAGLTIPAVIWIAKCTNVAVQMILLIGERYFDGTGDLGTVLREFSANGAVNFVASLLFVIAFLYFIIKALFKVGVRWFDLLMNMVASPFAWAAYVTNGTMSHLSNWMKNTGKLILINLVYAFYVTVISTIVIAPGAVESTGGFLARMLLIVGGIYRLANPPSWIKNMDSNTSAASIRKAIFQNLGFRKLVKK